MIEMNTVSALERTQTLVAPQASDVQAANQSANPMAPAARQAESMPGVQVEISSAAREVAARDALPETQNATAPANTAPEASPNQSATNESTNQPVATQTEDRSSSAAQARAMQMFNETAGIGLEQANNSTLRESV